MGKERELLKAAQVGNIASVEKFLNSYRTKFWPG